MFIFQEKKSGIIQIFISKKLPKILEIRQIREKTTSFKIFSLFFFFSNLSDCLALKINIFIFRKK